MRSRSSIPYLETRTGELFEDGNEWSKQHGQGKRLLGQLVGARWTLVRPAPVSEVSALVCCGHGSPEYPSLSMPSVYNLFVSVVMFENQDDGEKPCS